MIQMKECHGGYLLGAKTYVNGNISWPLDFAQLLFCLSKFINYNYNEIFLAGYAILAGKRQARFSDIELGC